MKPSNKLSDPNRIAVEKVKGLVPSRLELASSVAPEGYSKIAVRHSNGTVLEFESLADLQKSDQFPSILEDAKSEKVFSVDYRALVFIDKQNSRGLRPDPGDMSGIARRSSRGTMHMRLQHSQHQDSKIGLAGDLEEVPVSEAGATPTTGLSALMRLRSGAHQVQFMKGLLDEYSVGMSAKSVKCSTCSAAYLSWGPKDDLSFYPSCEHMPGRLSNDKKSVHEAIYVGTKIREISAVGVPAVTGVKNYTGKSLSAPDLELTEDPEIKETESEMEKELQDKITALESELAAAKASQKASADFATKLAGERLVGSLRLTKAELSGARVQKLITALGVEDAFETMMTWPARPELSRDASLSQDTSVEGDGAGQDPYAPPADGDPDEAELSAALAAARAKKGPPAPAKKPPTLFQRLKDRGEIK